MALAAFAPWAMLRLIPLAEVASAAASSLSAGRAAAIQRLQRSDAWATEGAHWIAKTRQMRDAARDVAADPVRESPDGAAAVRAGEASGTETPAVGASEDAHSEKPNIPQGSREPERDLATDPGRIGSSPRSPTWDSSLQVLDLEQLAAGATEPPPERPAA